ncbi:MAG: NAD(P)/FAD-dependent oxidoreductase, partial [Chloroflexi bacterium]|nr:NAD(P)/FAD-dependent oxidoreductase [Chloroflexota bacterium]
MTEKSIIVIGAGLAGLSAGCYAQMNGYRCHTFEHHSKPGGVAAAWKREGYLIDGGIHFLIGHRPGQPIFELYRELGIQTDDFPTLITYSRFIDEASGVSLDITGDLERLMHDLKAIAPADAGLIDDLVAGACAMQGSTILFEAGTGKPPELMNPLDLLRQFWSMRRTFKY